jgi:hypothetical protein
VSKEHPTTHEALAADLGFSVDSSYKQLYYGDNPRPASREEVLLWGRAVQAKAAFRASQHREAIADAENNSLKASCNAYREELQRLHDFMGHRYPIRETDDVIEFVMDTIVNLQTGKDNLLKKAREIYEIPPGSDIFEFMLHQLRHMTGEMAPETEQRRRDTIKERAERFPGDPMNSMLADELDKVQAKIAGRPVRDSPQA